MGKDAAYALDVYAYRPALSFYEAVNVVVELGLNLGVKGYADGTSPSAGITPDKGYRRPGSAGLNFKMG